MEEGRVAPRGRGAAALAALLKQKKEQQVGIQSQVPQQTSSIPAEEHGVPEPVAPAPRGRGASLLASYQKKKEEMQQHVGVQPVTSQGEAPKPKGRAAMLEKYYQTKLVGSTPESTSSPKSKIEEITKKIGEITTEDEALETMYYRGTTGKELQLSVNYIQLNIQKGGGVFQYEVVFSPELDAKSQRYELVNKIMGDLKTVKVFDGGSCLYLPQKFIDTQKSYDMNLTNGDQAVTVTIIFKKQKRLGDKDCLHLYNVLFKRIMFVLLYTRIGTNYYNTEHKHIIPQHKLEVYPGFVVTVVDRESDLLLCLDTQHKIIHNQTAYQLLAELKCSSDARNFKENAYKSFLGMCVITRYNHKTYIIHDILWDVTPKSTFPTHDGRSISYVEYYKNQYKLDILDHHQPLLLHRKSVTVAGSLEKEDRMICLVPELCYLTNLTDAMRNDFKLMKDVAFFTRITPQQRRLALRTYIDNVRNSERAQELLSQWGLSLAAENLGLTGRQLETETIIYGNQITKSAGPSADWNRDLGNNPVLMPVDIRNWVVFYTHQDTQCAREYANHMQRLSRSMGCHIAEPRLEKLPNDQTQTYITFVKDRLDKDVQVAVFICPSMRTDRYSVIKKLCCAQFPVASQVINARTLSKPDKVRSIILKIALQINCKLGGSLWTLRFPFKGWMICGIDVYHGAQNKSVCGFVSNLNENFTKWFSAALFQSKELGDFYQMAFTKALEEYKAHSGSYPGKVIIIRDGVGDGQLDHCKEHELKQFQNVLKAFQFETNICFVIVQKRISTRIFHSVRNGQVENPPPGTVVDHTITSKYLYDFFLISQNVRQATVNPTHYIVLHDSCNIKPDHIQRLCYKLCHLYYNWPGTIKVPAPCQYAHKLAAMVGQFVKCQPSPELATKLWYL